MYTILAYSMPEESHDILSGALTGKSTIQFCETEKNLFVELNGNEFDLVFLFIGNGAQGLTILGKVTQRIPHTPVIIISEKEDVEFGVLTLRKGAVDYLVYPVSATRYGVSSYKAIDKRSLQREIAYLRRKQDVVYHFDDVVASSPCMKRVLDNLKKFAKTDSTVLITGATGTGKSFLAGTVHFNSPRRKKAFIKINCANIPEYLLESELFGHEKGAFTSAEKQRIGRFEQANGGTLFLDEIGEISLGLQTKLLRVIEEKSFERVGGNKTIHVDVRVIAATNKNLSEQIEKGEFREDLYYRINILPIRLPPLRERRQCILPLVNNFLEKYIISVGSDVSGFTERALEQIQGYSWPGNIRQLANTIERAVILEEGEEIDIFNLSLPEEKGKGEISGHHPLVGMNGSLVNQEKELIFNALEECFWVQKNAAKKLGVTPRALNYKVKKFGITHPSWRRHK